MTLDLRSELCLCKLIFFHDYCRSSRWCPWLWVSYHHQWYPDQSPCSVQCCLAPVHHHHQSHPTEKRRLQSQMMELSLRAGIHRPSSPTPCPDPSPDQIKMETWRVHWRCRWPRTWRSCIITNTRGSTGETWWGSPGPPNTDGFLTDRDNGKNKMRRRIHERNLTCRCSRAELWLDNELQYWSLIGWWVVELISDWLIYFRSWQTPAEAVLSIVWLSRWWDSLDLLWVSLLLCSHQELIWRSKLLIRSFSYNKTNRSRHR